MAIEGRKLTCSDTARRIGRLQPRRDGRVGCVVLPPEMSSELENARDEDLRQKKRDHELPPTESPAKLHRNRPSERSTKHRCKNRS